MSLTTAMMPPLRLGLTQWSHNHWINSLYGKGCKSGDRLAHYAEVFNSVEGNTTFYATPSMTTVQKWHDATPDHFRFTFKLPQAITHQQQLRHCDQAVADFLSTMQVLEPKTGMWKIQLPAQFGPDALPVLAQFLDRLPSHLTTGVEVRHPEFFTKGAAEQALNRLLIEKNSNRIIMDSRPLFSAQPITPAIIEAQRKKPRLPVHAIATANNPVIRFIGHPNDSYNDPFFNNWLQRIPLWLAEGKQPYLFIHSPDNNHAPESAIRLYHRLQQHLAATITLPDLAKPQHQQHNQQISLL
ncbi:DUF72 domain-containing protein [Photobacterium phosphoreum]|jgi:uncharacterized protein YecE (DUF72 family)|uniref:DUF72 domain-containing protein n=1 Tax=Photobacterium phosphoreum TaxID=659 RepID=UPI0007F8807A|nr:DUF72 domain-containing protein [Photobacterium phosphoreum]MCD9473473.1 DUF72 domain-containing protein [Photobacterium phosphoreum]MCD9482572.1 DUF72 domain-containing protein [Photobacterium phosphoreum]MCD9505018.1 DUF72 domain-containing protein [Photobacterium phosphoreum]MCF2174299.1 DUF72 domain-containing protein [Photobacterium phosphoreum]OBU35554.1 hypothetical protein AYY24_03130 [Photobacterium phosphoreum]